MSVLMVLEDPHEAWVRDTVQALRSQAYPNWELCVCDNGSTRPHVLASLRSLRLGRRLRLERLAEPVDAAEAMAHALARARGELCAIVDCGDTLDPDALFRVVELIAATGADVVYTDEDTIDPAGELSEPVLKPAWSADLLLATNYLGRLCVVRRRLIDSAGRIGLRSEGGEHDLMLRVTERTRGVAHLPGVLYHRRVVADEPFGDRGPNPAAAESALQRRGEEGTVRTTADGGLRIERRASEVATIAAIVRVDPGATEAPILGTLERSDEIDEIVVAGGRAGAFGAVEQISGRPAARAANLAVATTTSDYLLFLEGRGRPRPRKDRNWVRRLLAHGERRGVAAVGPRLVYGDGRLRQGGGLIDLDVLSERPSERIPRVDAGARIASRPFNPMIVRGDCVLVPRACFEAVGGFDDQRLARSLYDVDLSLRLVARGLVNVYAPEVTYVCGYLREAPPPDEIAYLWEVWWDRLAAALSDQHPAARLAWRDSAGLAGAAAGRRP